MVTAFKKVLNIWSMYDESLLDAFPFVTSDLPTMAELEDAMSRLKARKAWSLSGILPEMVLCGGSVLLAIERLLVLC